MGVPLGEGEAGDDEEALINGPLDEGGGITVRGLGEDVKGTLGLDHIIFIFQTLVNQIPLLPILLYDAGGVVVQGQDGRLLGEGGGTGVGELLDVYHGPNYLSGPYSVT